MTKPPTAAMSTSLGTVRLVHTVAAQASAVPVRAAGPRPLAHRRPIFSECCSARAGSFRVRAVCREAFPALVVLAQPPVAVPVEVAQVPRR